MPLRGVLRALSAAPPLRLCCTSAPVAARWAPIVTRKRARGVSSSCEARAPPPASFASAPPLQSAPPPPPPLAAAASPAPAPASAAAAPPAADGLFESEPSLGAAPPLPRTGAVVYSALAGNAALCLLKAAVWARGGSPSMLAEALHSLVDTANSSLLALGLRQAAAGPDARFHFGQGRAAFVWALLSACGMLAVAGGVPVASGLLALAGLSDAAAALSS